VILLGFCHSPHNRYMLSTSSSSAVDLFFNDGDWDSTPPKLCQPTTTFTSWGVTSIGRGYNWNQREEQGKGKDPPTPTLGEAGYVGKDFVAEPEPMESQVAVHVRKHHSLTPIILYKPLIMTPPTSPRDTLAPWRPTTPIIQPLARSPSSPRRRRSSQQRVSLIAGQVSIAPIEPPSPPPGSSDTLRRTPSNRSFLSQAESTRPPTPSLEQTTFLGERNISEYLIDGEIGRGAYGLVKRAREFNEDGTLGVSLSE
jgi:protein-serine/threonine kinase